MASFSLESDGGKWYASLADLERDAARASIGKHFTATLTGSTSKHVDSSITVGLAGSRWQLVGRIESFEPPNVVRGRIVAVQQQPAEDDCG